MTARNPYHLLFVVLGLIVPRGLHASETTTVDFRRDVRPLLSDKCFRCHGPDEERASDIRLDQEASAKEVRHAGAAVVPFDPQHSLLMQRILTDDPAARMPPPESGLTLTAKETDLLNRWIAEGANWSEHWAFAPLHAESVPRTHSAWATGSIDRFVEARLTASGLTPSDAADRRTLIRRLSFDLTGLPPAPEDVEQFAHDDRPDAWERLIDRYLDSPAFGERWGRVWLDLARYADAAPDWLTSVQHAWRYRDWIIAACNEDLPYDKFVRCQLAADALPQTQLNDLAALGFLGLSPTYWKELRLAPTLIERIVADEWDERIDTVTRTFLGLTVSCARCHDHKFDPISREDYYGLAGVFASSQLAERPLLPAGEAMPVELARAQVRELEEKLSKLDKEDEAARNDVSRQIAMLRETTPHFDAPNVNILKDSAIYVLPDGPDQTRLEYRDGEARDLPVFERGNPASPGAIVERRFLTALSDDDPPPLGHGSGRLDLADALLGEARDLTARVIVNRIWEGHFGVGLVQTTSDFGSQGDPPSHPELLDFLASDLIRHDWSLKWLHREIVRSSTYRQASLNRKDCAAVDPENRLLWRMNRRRLEIEMLRDAMLTAAGRLDRQAGGIAFDLGDDSQNRRTVYGRIARQDLNDVLRLYDFPEPESHSPQRVHTTSPLQQLYMLNAAFVRAMADQVAAQLVDLPTQDERVHTAYRKLFGRDPNEVELSFGREFLATAAADGAELTDYVHTLLGLNEFLYVD